MIPETYEEDVRLLMDVFAGADGGIGFIKLCHFLKLCEEQGNDVPFIRQTAKLLRILETQENPL